MNGDSAVSAVATQRRRAADRAHPEQVDEPES